MHSCVRDIRMGDSRTAASHMRDFHEYSLALCDALEHAIRSLEHIHTKHLQIGDT